MANYKKKIQQLLALSESSNEYEARDALLKARKLMAKHKISEKDIEGHDSQTIEKRLTGITYSVRRNPWISDLAIIIAKHHCCRDFRTREAGKQTREVGFIGFTDDITICMEVFKYAVDCVCTKANQYRKTKGVKAADGYGYGFALGLLDAYDKQQKEEGWGLVMIVPEEVNKATSKMSIRKTTEKKFKVSDVHTFREGIQDGRKFTNKRIAKKE